MKNQKAHHIKSNPFPPHENSRTDPDEMYWIYPRFSGPYWRLSDINSTVYPDDVLIISWLSPDDIPTLFIINVHVYSNQFFIAPQVWWVTPLFEYPYDAQFSLSSYPDDDDDIPTCFIINRAMIVPMCPINTNLVEANNDPSYQPWQGVIWHDPKERGIPNNTINLYWGWSIMGCTMVYHVSVFHHCRGANPKSHRWPSPTEEPLVTSSRTCRCSPLAAKSSVLEV